jgi:adenylate kinase family enzyme
MKGDEHAVLMIAPPGAGKGTQGALIAAHFDIPHIATGELLRDHVARRTALGRARICQPSPPVPAPRRGP